jgi:hypothetical protein
VSGPNKDSEELAELLFSTYKEALPKAWNIRMTWDQLPLEMMEAWYQVAERAKLILDKSDSIRYT